MSNKSYRIVFFDRNNIRPNIEIIVRDVPAKYAAIDAATAELHSRAESDIRLITNGMHGSTIMVTDHKGETHKAHVLPVSPEYYNRLVDECWGIAEVMQIEGVSKGVSSESAVSKADAALAAAFDSCDSDGQGDSHITRRKRRWTKAQKRAAKAAREKGLSIAA